MQQKQTPPRLFNIAAGQAFLPCLVRVLYDDHLRQDLFGDFALEEISLYLPTRRAIREVKHIFLTYAQKLGKQNAVLLPTIHALGDMDEEDLFFTETQAAQDIFSLPPAIDRFERQFQIMKLVKAKLRADAHQADMKHILSLTKELIAFLDHMQSELIDWDQFAHIVPDMFAENWQKNLDFLTIIGQAWPRHLAEEGKTDIVARRVLLIQKRIQQWQETPPAHPIIAAGSTASRPVTALLLRAISHLPNGAVILPGMDTTMDDTIWAEIEEDVSHPQYNMAQFLSALNVTRHAVAPWPDSAPPSARAGLLGRALLPSACTDKWMDYRAAINAEAGEAHKAMHDLHIIEADDTRSEAGAIALYMREILESQNKTAALVTPDRNLARRVAHELRRWDIVIDDSAGVPLAHAAEAVFARLILDVVKSNFAPVPLMAMLKHPLCCIESERAAHLRLVWTFERMIMRGPRPKAGVATLRAMVEKHNATEAQEIIALLTRLETILEPLLTMAQGQNELAQFIDAHSRAITQLNMNEQGEADCWHSQSGVLLYTFFVQCAGQAAHAMPLGLDDYMDLLALWLSDIPVRAAFDMDARLFIWGSLEARLMHADVMILGGLNEGVWPQVPDSGPWLSRPMRKTMGMSLPEQRIGLSAHDFVQNASLPHVVLTRAKKQGDMAVLPSRWLRRVDALMGGCARVHKYIGWWQHLGYAETVIPAPPPAPTPPLGARPKQLSVTQIDTLIKDPYAIYARHILNLLALSPLDEPVTAALRGIVIHEIFDRFNKTYPHVLPESIEMALRSCVKAVEADMPGAMAVMTYWRARINAIAAWMETFERARRKDLDEIFSEIKGAFTLNHDDMAFTLTAKADRIERYKNGAFVILDYKTGTLPSKINIDELWSPQLPLEALILSNNGFDDIMFDAQKNRTTSLDIVKLSGGDPAGEHKSYAIEDEQIAKALAMLRNLIAAYQSPDQAYHSHLRPEAMPGGFKREYDHLARVQEWRNADEGGGDKI